MDIRHFDSYMPGVEGEVISTDISEVEDYCSVGYHLNIKGRCRKHPGESVPFYKERELAILTI